jgi:hypothetical protein
MKSIGLRKNIGASVLVAAAIGVCPSAADLSAPMHFDLPGLGVVRFELVTTVGVGERPTIKCFGPNRELLAEVPIGEPVAAEDDTTRGVQLLKRSFDGLPDPMIIALVETTHGDGCGFQVTCFAVAGGKLKVLLRKPIEFWNDGGIFIGDLSHGRGPGIAIWKFLWDDCHACPSRFAVRFYPWNAEMVAFSEVASDTMVTSRRYDNWTDALDSLGLPFNDMLYEFEGLKDYW